QACSHFIPSFCNPSTSRHRLYPCTFHQYAKTLRGTLWRPPKCCLFCWSPALLLFRGLLRGLLCGCLLGCFLSCHLPILPFRWFASSSATFVAVEEMYRFMRSQCQEKNDDGVEKVATTSSTHPLTYSSSEDMSRVKKCHCQSCHCIVP